MNTEQELQVFREELAEIRKEIAELRGPRNDAIRRHRWFEVCRCFRDNKGSVTVYEADEYLGKTRGYCKKLVVAGFVQAKQVGARTSKRLFVDAGAIELAVRTGYI